MANIDEALKQLAQARPQLEISRSDEDVDEFSHDWWIRGTMSRRIGQTTRAEAVVRPRDTADVSALAAWAEQTKTPIVPYGLGSGVCGAIALEGRGVVIDMGAMNALLDVDETSLLATVQPGMCGADFEAALRAKGYTMGHFPQSIDLSTVGGWCATRASGQLSTLYGNIEDMLLGCEVVLPGGEVIDIPATTRSATGPDLKNLFLGSEGILGIMTKLVFRIHPLPEAETGQSFTLPDVAAGIEALRLILRAGWRPPVTRLYDAVEAGRNFQIANDDLPVLLLLSQGPKALVDVEAKAIAEIVRSQGGVAKGEEPVTSWLEHRNNVPDLHSLLEQGLVVDTIEIAAKWQNLAPLFEDVCREGNAIEEMIAMSGHVSHCYTQGANIYFTFVATEQDPNKAVALYDRAWNLTMEKTLAHGGTIAHHHGIGRVRKEWLKDELGTSHALLARLKKAIDPSGIMNPGAVLDVKD
jgi:alkyldihydroxyacetonephosphate synthase